VIQVVHLTFGHDGVEPTVHSAKIRVRLGLRWQVCIKYAQTVAAKNQVCGESSNSGVVDGESNEA